MSAVLGISGLYHDSAAALVVDGQCVAAMAEERLSRRKGDAVLPRRAIQACLARGKLQPNDLDQVVFYENPYAKLERVVRSLAQSAPRSFRQFPLAMRAQLTEKLWIVDQLAELLQIGRERVSFGNHHRSHAAAAFLTSPYQDAAVLIADGVGEFATTTLWSGRGTELKRLASIDYPHSLGLLYAAITAYLGFAVNRGEQKVMGLAAFGQPRFQAEFAKLLEIDPSGGIRLELSHFDYHAGTEVAFGRTLEQLLGPRRLPTEPWQFVGGKLAESDQRYADIAASLQLRVEQALLALAHELHRRTGHRHLCLGGGVALNARANHRLLVESPFERVYVQPAATDAGGALGAALDFLSARVDLRPDLGVCPDPDHALEVANELGLSCERVASPGVAVARELAERKIVGIATGGFEWGPRALGHRSILSCPIEERFRERLNAEIKKRHAFQPFAPAVLAAEAPEHFDDAPNDLTPWMAGICRMKRPDELGAVRHIDNTARVQTVSEPGLLCSVLEAVREHWDVPIVLNTSLNGPGEPIAGDTSSLLGMLLAHPLDALYVEDLRISRPAS